MTSLYRGRSYCVDTVRFQEPGQAHLQTRGIFYALDPVRSVTGKDYTKGSEGEGLTAGKRCKIGYLVKKKIKRMENIMEKIAS